jgi:arachidonate 15-lipoxygenase
VAEKAESSVVAEIEAAIAKAANSFLSTGDTVPRVEGRATSLADYDAIFCTIDVPAIRDTYQLDRSFARMRLAGPNPAMIERVPRPSAKLPITEAHYQVAMADPEDSLDLAGAEGRLFQLDYAGLDGLLEGTYPGYRKYMPAPIALFAVPRSGDDRALRPVAIQTEQRSSATSPVLTPADGEAWSVAKNAVQVADGCYHEAVSHLARTHFLVEPFVIATKRQLSSRHPLHVLLEPHFEGTLYINDSAQSALIAPEGGVNKLLAPSIDAARLAAILGVQSYPFDEAGLERQLVARGVDDPEKIPDYPFRDDGRLIWAAIQAWVTRYVALYYTGDDHVAGDYELQAWAAELLSFEGGRVVGFGQDGGVKTRDYLIEVVTTLIFTASAQHAAVNFPQGSIMAYTPAQPLAAYAPSTPTATLLDVLPPLDQALAQTELGRSLGLAYYTQLGRYRKNTFRDPRVADPLAEFQAELERIEAVIVERNKHREPYTDLLPSKIPQSINI